MSQNRYITFSGDPAGKPLRYTFHRAADFKAAGLAGAASYLMASAFPLAPVKLETNEEIQIPADGIGIVTLFLNAVNCGLGRWLEKSTLKTVDLDSEAKCIDKEPDHSTPPTSADDLRKSEEMKRYYCIYGGSSCWP